MSHLQPHHAAVGQTNDTSGYSTYGYDYEVVRLDRDDPIEYAITARYLQRYIADGSVVADIGVGVGHYSELLARRECTVHLVDVSRRLLETAAERLRLADIGQKIASVTHASATDLSFLPDACCDAVLLLGPLYHLGDAAERRNAIAEAARILRPSGLLFAAGINRLTYLRDVLRDAPDDFARRVSFFARFVHDGNFDPPLEGYPATVHLTTSDELRAECGACFTPLVLAGAESFASKREGASSYHRASPDAKSAILDLVETTGTTSEGLGLTSHYLYIGRKADV